VQVDPIKPTLKAPGTERLKLKHDVTTFNLCLQIQLAPLHQGGEVAGVRDKEQRKRQ
jgi:hypothetical protein